MPFCRILLNNINYKCIFCIFRYRWATGLVLIKCSFNFSFRIIIVSSQIIQ